MILYLCSSSEHAFTSSVTLAGKSGVSFGMMIDKGSVSLGSIDQLYMLKGTNDISFCVTQRNPARELIWFGLYFKCIVSCMV